MKFKKDIEVNIHDVDHNGIARASALMKYIQTAAQDQLTENNMSYDQLKAINRAFILSRIKIEFTEAVRAYDRVTAVSYPCESRGYSWLRCYSLEKEGNTIGRAVSIWALIDVSNHSLIKVNDFEFKLPTDAPNSLALTRFHLPSAISVVGTYTVNYGDLDQNCHMNNTRYPDVYANFLNLDGKRIKTITINYMNEAPRGEKLTVERAEAENGIYYFRTIRQDGKINTEAEIEICDI